MPSLEDVQKVLLSATNDCLKRVEDIDKIMLFINSIQQVPRYKFVVKAVVDLKKVPHHIIPPLTSLPS